MHPASLLPAGDSPLVFRYVRTDAHRLGPWQPVDSAWRTAASAGLVAHDVYQHLPGDTGTLAQELATVGAEWYIEVQPLPQATEQGFLRGEKALRRAVSDSVLNALESGGGDVPYLPATQSMSATALEQTLFGALAAYAVQALPESRRPQGPAAAEYARRVASQIALGAAQARVRFPDQQRVRQASRKLAATLADLDEAEVPLGHEIVVTLTGYDAAVTFTDADAAFKAQRQPDEAFMMFWCTAARGFPRQYATLHGSEAGYRDFMRDHFEAQARGHAAHGGELDPDQEILPETEAHGLRQVYVVSEPLRSRLRNGEAVRLSLPDLLAADFTPRGVWVV